MPLALINLFKTQLTLFDVQRLVTTGDGEFCPNHGGSVSPIKSRSLSNGEFLPPLFTLFHQCHFDMLGFSVSIQCFRVHLTLVVCFHRTLTAVFQLPYLYVCFFVPLMVHVLRERCSIVS